MRRWARRVGSSLFLLVALLGGAAIFTARSGDPQLYPASQNRPRVEVFVVSHGYHAGIVLPRQLVADLAGTRGHAALIAVAARFGHYRWLEVGWGDEGFYTSVPTIASLTLVSALRALLRPGNASVVHVVGLTEPLRESFPQADIVRLELSEAGFERLLGRLEATFAPGAAGEPLGRGLYGPSLFYRAVGTFHVFNVCNHWVAAMLDAAGVPTALVLATLPSGLLLDLRWRAGAVLL